MNKANISRLMTPIIEKYLQKFGGILIVGPKWCGKTYQGLLFANSKCMIQEDVEGYKSLLNIEIEKNTILNGKWPRLIDEWQDLPSIWDKTRLLIDLNLNKPGQFILTGSTMVNYSKIHHSGAGRFADVKMSTLTFYEILKDKTNDFISISELFDNLDSFKPLPVKYDLEWIGNNMITGGWPSFYSINDGSVADNETALKYVNSIEQHKSYLVLKMKKVIIHNLLKSIARLNGFQIKHSTILSDLNGEISKNVLPKYLEYFESMFFIDYLESWSLNVRSKTKIINKPKMYLADTSLGLAILNIDSYKKLLSDPRLFGVYFENQVIKDLKVFAESLSGQLFFYRDKNDFEIDAIFQLKDGRWAPFEIKLTEGNKEAIDKAAKNLLSIENKIKTDYGMESKPSFYMIITADKFCYKRDDGVLVVPFTLLKP